MTAPTYILGLDLGQASDFTVLAVLECTRRADGLTARHYALRGLKRWPLGTPYPTIVADVQRIVSTPPVLPTGNPELAASRRPLLAVDASGVGRPVVDMFRLAKLSAKLFPVTITAGHAESFADGTYHVAKVVLISSVQVLLQERRLQFSAKLPETPTLVKEFQDYRVRVTAAAHETFNAREGAHDDVVLAVALAAWLGELPGAGPATVEGELLCYPAPPAAPVPARPDVPLVADEDITRHVLGKNPDGTDRIIEVDWRDPGLWQ